jgi:hypothetical protein
MGESSQPDDLDQLRERFPGWTFGRLWITVANGPDKRRLWASHGAIFLSAWSTAALAAEVGAYKFPQNGASHEGPDSAR